MVLTQGAIVYVWGSGVRLNHGPVSVRFLKPQVVSLLEVSLDG